MREPARTAPPLQSRVRSLGVVGAPARDLICKEGLGCDSETKTCPPKRHAGAPCRNDGICESGTCYYPFQGQAVCTADYCRY